MSRPMKYHPHKSVVFVTFSIEQGLLLLNNALGHLIVKSCLAQAQFLYPVTICHLLVEANHVHLLIVVDNPNDVPDFVGHFKTESAHYINGLLGRRKRTVWCEGYDSPIVLTFRRALMVIAYFYGNPAKDNLTEDIDSYPGFSTWRMFRKGVNRTVCKRVSRPQFTLLTKDSHNLRGYTKRAEEIAKAATSEIELTIDPNAWLEAFGIVDPDEQKRVNRLLVERVRTLEARASSLRIRDNKIVVGRERLINQKFDLTYLPNRSGKRMWCLSEKRSVRTQFIKFFKDLMVRAREVRRRWRIGDFSVPYPPGLHAPNVPRLADVLSVM